MRTSLTTISISALGLFLGVVLGFMIPFREEPLPIDPAIPLFTSVVASLSGSEGGGGAGARVVSGVVRSFSAAEGRLVLDIPDRFSLGTRALAARVPPEATASVARARVEGGVILSIGSEKSADLTRLSPRAQAFVLLDERPEGFVVRHVAILEGTSPSP